MLTIPPEDYVAEQPKQEVVADATKDKTEPAEKGIEKDGKEKEENGEFMVC